ncbi:TlpA disulfide reductase family protein [Pedobacter sp. JY14-1]|uniref:TlpA family protein disulfide reductase n=1 Tax=Pedobacter sp. JY14-1 TaxID=3034151 RepID=UPI0023E2DA48|nr:TlpA disulfide reductase family protein [Pedobacter sp. JY14-1]
MPENNFPGVLFFIILFYSCNAGEATFHVRAENFGPNAMLSIQDATGKALLQENLLDRGQSFRIKPGTAGYGKITVHKKNGDNTFWTYIEEGTYELLFNGKEPSVYPVKAAGSPAAKEIMRFYQLQDSLSHSIHDSLQQATMQFESADRAALPLAIAALEKWRTKNKEIVATAIEAFATAYPASGFVPVLLEDYASDVDPPRLRKIIGKLSPALRKSPEIAGVSTELNRLEHLRRGSKMAGIAGHDLNGKPFDPGILKEINLFICWMSYDNPSRKNNPELADLYASYKSRNVEFIGISYDRYEKWWRAVVKDDRLIWPQYADLKGSKSPNPGNLSNYRAPYLFITDRNGVILSDDVPMGNLKPELDEWLEKASAKRTSP